MLRPLPVFVGLGLLVLWTIGLLLDSSTWLSWTVGLLAVGPFAAVGLVTERGPARAAGVVLLLTSAALLGSWLAALAQGATPWLTWWTLVFAGLAGTAALAAFAQGLLDDLRARPLL